MTDIVWLDENETEPRKQNFATRQLLERAAGARELLTAARTYYVRTDGVDTNTGLVNSATGAFLTIQNVISTLDLGGYVATVQVADGTYTGGMVAPYVTGGVVGDASVIVQGNSGTPGNVIVSVTSLNAVLAYATTGGTIFKVKDMELRTTTGGSCISAIGPTQLRFENIRFGVCAGAHIYANSGALIWVSGNFSTVGNAVQHYVADHNSCISLNGYTDTYSGTLTFSSANAVASSGAVLAAEGATQTVAGGGSVTATRYLAQINGAIVTGGAGANFFPGNVAGSSPTGGQYA